MRARRERWRAGSACAFDPAPRRRLLTGGRIDWRVPPLDDRFYNLVTINYQERTVSHSNDNQLRGADQGGSEAPEAVDHVARAKLSKRDGELHLDDEKDTLFDDGLDVEDESLTLAGTQGNPNKG